MRNINLLATEKPTFLHKLLSTGNLITSISCIDDMKNAIGQNIYITSNRKPKAGDWSIYQNDKIHKCMEDIVGDSFKKIILTTDQDLIDDGVQAIDDNFLEWFVENSNCEEIEVTTYHVKGDISGKLHYKIIIPKEPKQEKWDNLNKELDDALEEEFGSEEPKQETLDEVAEKYAEGKSSNSTFRNTHIRDFKAGADWQQERMYSEEEVLDLLLKSKIETSNLYYEDMKEWFEQFKKK